MAGATLRLPRTLWVPTLRLGPSTLKQCSGTIPGMPTYRAQVIIPHGNGIPADAMTNTLHFIDFVPQPLADLADDVTPIIEDLYEAIYVGSGVSASYYAWTNTRVKWYDLAQPTPRVPYELPMPINVSPTATTIPAEVAAVASFQANREPGVPQARRRGRIYLGGLNSVWMVASSAGAAPRLDPGMLTRCATAFEAFRDAVALTSARWAVWSPTDQAASLVTNGWMENDPDTQRRRGAKASIRTSWS